MKIVIICKNFPNKKCGVGDYTFMLIKKLIEIYPYLDIFVITSKTQDIVKIRETRITILPIIEKWNSFCIAKIISTIKELRPKWTIFQYVPHSFNQKGIPTYLIFLLIYVKFFSKTCIFFHETAMGYGNNPKQWIISLLQKSIANFLYLLANVNITSNKSTASVLWFGSPDIVRIGSNIVCSVKKESVDSLRKTLTNNGGNIVLAMFGNIRKNNIVLPALSKLEEHGIPWQLVLIGNYNKNNAKQFFDDIQKLHIANKVIVTGYLPSKEVYKYLKASDIFITLDMPGGIFLHSGALSAAFSASLITIGNKGYLTDDILKHEKNIILLNKISEEEVLFYINKIVKDKSFREQMRHEIEEFYQTNFSWEVICKEYGKLLGLDYFEN